MILPTACNLFIVRHGESSGNAKGLWQGHQNYDLTPKGEQQAQLTKKYLSCVPMDKIQTSNLQRSISTAQIINGQNQTPIGIEPNWQEMNFGLWEGKSTPEINKMGGHLVEWYENPASTRVPGGETFEEVQNRVIEAYTNLYNQVVSEDNRNVLIVAHGGTIRSLACYLTGVPLANVWKLRVNHCSVTRVSISNNQSVLTSFNESRHLGTSA